MSMCAFYVFLDMCRYVAASTCVLAMRVRVFSCVFVRIVQLGTCVCLCLFISVCLGVCV